MILILNCGSQSVKWKLFGEDLKELKGAQWQVLQEEGYQKLLESELQILVNQYGKNISKIGHRIVHNGGKFKGPLLIDDKTLKELKEFNNLAPLHNPYNILGIESSQKFFPDAKQIGVFDTDFFFDLPDVSKTYPLPPEILEKFGFKRLGFHGISHEFAAREGAKKIGKDFKKIKIITCHLGGGASLAAIKNGKAIDTSMGFTPLEGVVMMTRPGSIDPGIVLKLIEKYPLAAVEEMLNKKGGLFAISQTKEMLEIIERLKKKDEKAKLAFEIFVYSIKKYIGAYFAILGGCDLIVFTGSIGAGLAITRNQILKGLDILKNTKVLAIRTDEELAIAQKINKLILTSK